MLLGTQVLALRKKTGAQKENWCKRKLAEYITGEAMAICSEESSPSSTNSATWRASEVKPFQSSFKQKSYDSNFYNQNHNIFFIEAFVRSI